MGKLSMKDDRVPSAANKVMDSIREAIIKLTEDRTTDGPRGAQPAATKSEAVKRASRKIPSRAKV
jgi:hypothetical protein